MKKIERIILTKTPLAYVLNKSKHLYPPGFEGVPLFDVVRFFYKQIKVHGLSERASAISYNFIMAIPPSLLFVFTLIPNLPFISKKTIQNNSKSFWDSLKNPTLDHFIDTNIREIEGVLNGIVANSVLLRKDIDLELAKRCIQNTVEDVDGEVSIDYIQKFVANFYGIDIDLLKSKTRKREVVQARQIAMYFAKSMTKSSLATIGLHCGGKDHATVLHACRTVNNLMDTDKRFRGYIEDLKKKISLVIAGMEQDCYKCCTRKQQATFCRQSAFDDSKTGQSGWDKTQGGVAVEASVISG